MLSASLVLAHQVEVAALQQEVVEAETVLEAEGFQQD